MSLADMNHTLIPLYYCILCLLIHLFIHMPLPVLLNFQTEACFKICPIEFYVFLVFFFYPLLPDVKIIQTQLD